ncbi:Hypothetical protein Ccan_07430 [Capnocytophaga canimorsus Cc5]|uniref:Uncharacterized protein n=1 Tax=Capnocytophaga canimorsus (strain 5) TaxID=860228 RepID=F9YTJ9_CAPCC|nr:Hypothetical protein Ccan_07430 [Capnocytophaga canimorsus Cc5]
MEFFVFQRSGAVRKLGSLPSLKKRLIQNNQTFFVFKGYQKA